MSLNEGIETSETGFLVRFMYSLVGVFNINKTFPISLSFDILNYEKATFWQKSDSENVFKTLVSTASNIWTIR